MKWGFLFQLFLMLVELCDPTTPFVRVGHRAPSPARGAVVAVIEAEAAGLAFVHEEGAKSVTARDMLEAPFHFSLVAVSFSLPERSFHAGLGVRDTGLPESHFIDVPKRPPISKTALS